MTYDGPQDNTGALTAIVERVGTLPAVPLGAEGSNHLPVFAQRAADIQSAEHTMEQKVRSATHVQEEVGRSHRRCWHRGCAAIRITSSQAASPAPRPSPTVLSRQDCQARLSPSTWLSLSPGTAWRTAGRGIFSSVPIRNLALACSDRLHLFAFSGSLFRTVTSLDCSRTSAMLLFGFQNTLLICELAQR